jgi:murein DD-endopeptidase MepM/ murein hydrolase activator NlpD
VRRVAGWCRDGLLVFLVVFLVVIGGSSSAAVESTPCWRPPVAGAILDPFRAPACRWCAGNRGIEYEVAGTTTVLAIATGTVTFSGEVAGIRYVVVRLPNGWRTTYGRLEATRVELGDVVVAGSRIGTASGELFFGLRIGEDYVDPAPFIGAVVGRARLIPVDGSSAPPAPAPPDRQPRVRCRVGESAR